MTSSNGRAITARTSNRKRFWVSEAVPGSAAVACCGVGSMAIAWADPSGRASPAKGSVPISLAPAACATGARVAAPPGTVGGGMDIGGGVGFGVGSGLGVGRGVGGGVGFGVGGGVGVGVGGGDVAVGVGDGCGRAATLPVWLEAQAPEFQVIPPSHPQAPTTSIAAASARARWRKCMPSPCLLPRSPAQRIPSVPEKEQRVKPVGQPMISAYD